MPLWINRQLAGFSQKKSTEAGSSNMSANAPNGPVVLTPKKRLALHSQCID